MDEVPPLTLSAWPTPLTGHEVHLIDVSYLSTRGIDLAGKGSIRFDPSIEIQPHNLSASVFVEETGEIFAIEARAQAVRILDEHGLPEIWSAPQYQDRRESLWPTLKVAGHCWHRESELSFGFTGPGFSYLISTGMDCIEIIAKEEPTFRFVRTVTWE